jgi:hypothetical protein
MGIDANTPMARKTTGRKIVGRGMGLLLHPPRLLTSGTRPTTPMRRNTVTLLLRRPEAQMHAEIALVQMDSPIEPYECSLKTSETVTVELMEITYY